MHQRRVMQPTGAPGPERNVGGGHTMSRIRPRDGWQRQREELERDLMSFFFFLSDVSFLVYKLERKAQT